MYFDQLNWLAVLAAAVSAFAIGGIWYGPLFKNAWCREAGMDMAGANRRHPAKVFGTAFATLFYLFEVIIVVGIQAFIFATLSAIYIGSAIEPEH